MQSAHGDHQRATMGSVNSTLPVPFSLANAPLAATREQGAPVRLAGGPPPAVFEVLSHTRATLERRASLGDALQLAQWRNQHDRTGYQQPGHHTLSVYVQGGQGTRFLGTADVNVGEHGAPWRCCVLPAEHESGWEIEAPFRFVHLYVSAQAWADRVVRLLDAEPRTHTLERRIFWQDPVLARWAQQVTSLDWSDPSQRLQAHAASHGALDHLVLQAARPRQRQAAERLTGGLSATARRQVLMHIDTHLADASGGELLLGHLAALVHLSEFHFARMFRLSMGCSVHGWVMQRRMARAQQLLVSTRLPLAHVAMACGLGSASHLSQAFRQHLGSTPAQFRQGLQFPLKAMV